MAKYRITPSSKAIIQLPISIGHKAEKGVEAIEFDLTAWVETYGSGTLTVIMRRWGDAIPYPIALEIDENNKAVWTLSDIDTAKAGMAYAQLNYIVGDEVVKKSDIYTFRVMDSLTGEGDPPEAYESWLEHLTHLAAEAMAEVLDIEGIVTDKTLTVDGGIADAKATGEALAEKVDAADYSALSARVGANTIALAKKADQSNTYTKAQVDGLIEDVTVETDTTLAVSGAPADSKKVGDELTAIKAALDDQLGSSEETTPTVTPIEGYTILVSNGICTLGESTTNSYAVFPVSEGDVVTYSKAGTSLGSCCFFSDATTPINYTNFAVPTATEQTVTAPAGANYVGFSGIKARLVSLVVKILHETKGVVYDVIDAKLDLNQGASNAGKILRVGVDGNTVPDDFIPSTDVVIVQSGWAGATTKPQTRYANCKGIDFSQGDTITPKSGYECAVMNSSGGTVKTWFSTAYELPSDKADHGIVIRKTNAAADIVLDVDGYKLTDYISETYDTTNADYIGNEIGEPASGLLVNKLMQNIGKSKWYGKKVAFIGDSITAGAQAGTGALYYQIINSAVHFGTVVVDAVAGSGYSGIGTDKTPIYDRVQSLATDFDLIVIFAGTNDFGHSAPIGTLADTTDISFCGAVQGSFLEILSSNPSVRLVVMTPLHRASGTYDGEDDVNTEGKVLLDYVEKLKEICAKYSVPIIDTYQISGINPNVSAIGTAYFADGLHINADGHALLAERILPYFDII